MWPHGPQHAILPCSSPTPEVCSDSCLLSQWCHTTISLSVSPFSSCSQSLPASRATQRHVHEYSQQHYSQLPKSRNSPNVHPLMNGYTKVSMNGYTKVWYSYTMEYSAIRKEWSTDNAKKWVNLDNIMLSERNQLRKVTCYVIPCIWNVQNR